MHKTIISDTSCFIILTKIGEIELLKKVYGQVVTTFEVASEYGEELPEWVEITSATDKMKQQLLEMQIDKGEASAIALAIETKDCTIILDDLKVRRIAEKLGLEITGTIGIIIKAKLRGLIPFVKPLLEKIKSTDFRLSDDVIKKSLKEAGE